MTLKEIVQANPTLNPKQQLELYNSLKLSEYNDMVSKQIEILNQSKYIKITKGDYYEALIHVKSFELMDNDFGSKSIKYSGEKIEIIKSNSSSKIRKFEFQNKWLEDFNGMSIISKQEFLNFK